MAAAFDECMKDCLLINDNDICSAFYKVLIEECLLEVLVVPRGFARSTIPHLVDREITMEDTCGRLWKATMCHYNGSIAIKQGWPKFSSEHNLKVSDLLAFNYVPSDEHFFVKIYGADGCENINFEAVTDMVGKSAEDVPLLDPKDEKSKNVSQHVIESAPADSGDTLSLNADNYIDLVSVPSQDFMELRESLLEYLPKRKNLGRWIIFLQGPDKRIWPTYCHSRSNSKVILTSGWEKVAAVYGINTGAFCLFRLVDKERLLDVRKV